MTDAATRLIELSRLRWTRVTEESKDEKAFIEPVASPRMPSSGDDSRRLLTGGGVWHVAIIMAAEDLPLDQFELL